MSDGFSGYNKQAGKIKFDSVKHPHKRSLRGKQSGELSEWSNEYTSPQKAEEGIGNNPHALKSRRSFKNHGGISMSKRYSNQIEASMTFYKHKVNIFKRNQSLGVRNVNSTKMSLRNSNRKIDIFNKSILNNEHDLTDKPKANNPDVRVP